MSFKIKYCWLPKRLARSLPDRLEFIGWVWFQKAYLTKNINFGWIAFLDDQTKTKIEKSCCPYCNRILPDEFQASRGEE